MSELERCPKCDADFTGEPIPLESQESFGGKPHFSRLICLYDTALDRVTAWQCPDCAHTWPREWPPEGFFDEHHPEDVAAPSLDPECAAVGCGGCNPLLAEYPCNCPYCVDRGY